MTYEIALVLGILGVALILFVTEVLRMDLVALLVLVALAITGLVDTESALSGFSNPAVVTVWAMFILSDGLTRTGIADILGTLVLRIAGHREFMLIVVIMLTAGSLSVFHEQHWGSCADVACGHRCCASNGNPGFPTA